MPDNDKLRQFLENAEKTKSPTAQYQELLYPARMRYITGQATDDDLQLLTRAGIVKQTKQPKEAEKVLSLATAGGDTLRAKTYSGLLKEKASFNVLRGQGTRADSALAGYPQHVLSKVNTTPIDEQEIKTRKSILQSLVYPPNATKADSTKVEQQAFKQQTAIQTLQEKQLKGVIMRRYGGKQNLVKTINGRIEEMKKAGVSGPEIRNFIDEELKRIGLTMEDLR